MKKKPPPSDSNAPADEVVEAKHAIAEVFRRTGGVDGFTRWAKSHRALFYSLYTKLIPVTLQAQVHAKIEDSGDRKEKFDLLIEAMVANRVQSVIDERDGIVKVFQGGPDIEQRFREAQNHERRVHAARAAAAAIDGSEPVADDATSQPPYPYTSYVDIDATSFTRVSNPDPPAPKPAAAAPRAQRAADPSKPRQLSPQEARERAMAPSFPAQPSTEPNSTTYYEWMNGAGSRPWFGPIGSGVGPP
jgi:hypothetical protein